MTLKTAFIVEKGSGVRNKKAQARKNENNQVEKNEKISFFARKSLKFVWLNEFANYCQWLYDAHFA